MFAKQSDKTLLNGDEYDIIWDDDWDYDVVIFKIFFSSIIISPLLYLMKDKIVLSRKRFYSPRGVGPLSLYIIIIGFYICSITSASLCVTGVLS